MLDPTRQLIDQILLEIAIASFAAGTLVLLGYLLTRTLAFKRLGSVLAVLGGVTAFAELGTRWWMTGIWPLTNLYGSLSLFAAMGVLIFCVFAFKYDLWFAGSGVLAIAAIALAYGTDWNEGYMPAVPALQSYWIKIHVPLVISAYATFMVAFAIAILYIIKDTIERNYGSRTVRARAAGLGVDVSLAQPAASAFVTTEFGIKRVDTPNLEAAAARGDSLALWLMGLPSLSKLDILTYRIVAVGLPLLSIGIITGAMWAKEAWGAYWQWDPKETAALASWIVYALYMHLHTRNGWRGIRCAWINVAGFASIVFCYLGVNIWISGLHSYKV